MSMPIFFLKCQSCSAQWTSRMVWGLFSYELPDDRLAHVDRTILWCNDCGSYCPVERLPEMHELEAKLAKEQQELELARSEKPKDQITFWFIRKPGKIDTDKIRIYEKAVEDVKSKIAWKILRQSPRKCLMCGSQDLLDQGNPFKDPQIHPGCGGVIEVEDPEINIAARHIHKIYDIEGNYLRKEDC